MFHIIRKDGHDFCIVNLFLSKHFKQKEIRCVWDLENEG